jgi:tRNA threonylcarbamoyladenosine biosynthesis protein TsaE
MDFDFVSNSPEQTIEIGRKIGAQLKGGEILAVSGPLGSGKTHLIKGIAAGAGAADCRHVNSPTFVIVNEYIGPLHIYHIDAYRLDSIAEFEMLGFDDFCHPQAVVLIEWADKIESALAGLQYVSLSLSHAGPTQRAIHIDNAPAHITL